MKTNKFIIGFLLVFNFLSCKEKSPIITPPPPIIITPLLSGFSNNYMLINGDSTLENKLFYFLTLLEKSKGVKQAINKVESLNNIKKRYTDLFLNFSWKKYTDIQALGADLLLTTQEIQNVDNALEQLSSDNDIKNMVEKHLNPSGKYENYFTLDPKNKLKVIWRESVAKGINTIINQYLNKLPPVYPDIDGPDKTLSGEEYKKLIAEKITVIKNDPQQDMFFSQVKTLVVEILKINNRNEAIRFEPLEKGENSKAINYLSQIKWNDFTYSSILLLGDSPNSAGDAINISESAKNRIKIAVEAFNQKIAPIIIISGANIFPYQTPYFEAIEMKEWMMNNFGIEEKHILVEPCARHTTTNLRNASRLIYRYKIPSDKKSVIISTKAQNDIIQDPTFKARCIKELGYMPIKIGIRINDTRLEYHPEIFSLHTGSTDPLDP